MFCSDESQENVLGRLFVSSIYNLRRQAQLIESEVIMMQPIDKTEVAFCFYYE